MSGQFTVGDVIAGKFRVDGELGRGGMGVVYAATDLRLQRRVAVKLLLPAATSTPGIAQRFLREAHAAAQLKSRHAVQIFESDLHEGSPYIAMELLSGQSLEAELHMLERIPVTQAVDYVLQACEALAEAHRLGIIHRDLKPANLFLETNLSDSGKPGIRVLDFGIAKLTELAGPAVHLTDSQQVLGTPLYMAPEQRRGAPDIDEKADIWALGVILYELTSGVRPFLADSRAELDALVLHAPPQPLHARRPEIPAPFSQLVMKCLEKDPEARFWNVARLALQLVPFGPPGAADSAERIARARRATLPLMPANGRKPPSPAVAVPQQPGGDGGRALHGMPSPDPADPAISSTLPQPAPESADPPQANGDPLATTAVRIGNAKDLVPAILHSTQVTFLVGSALTYPYRDEHGEEQPGVPSVEGVIELIMKELEGAPEDLAGLKAKLEGKANRYQAAFEYLSLRRDQECCNRIVRRAVLKARFANASVPSKQAEGGNRDACKGVEADATGWSLSDGVRHLGLLVKEFPDRFGAKVLTSNFDPLIQVAIRRAGGKSYALALGDDGSLRQVIGLEGCPVVHFHGYWFDSDTLHTPAALTHRRPRLKASLKQLLTEKDRALVVLAYGGWDDIFTRSLIEVVEEGVENFNVLWTFYESDEEKIRKGSAKLLNALKPGIAGNRVRLYGGINVHKLLPELLKRAREKPQDSPDPPPPPPPPPPLQPPPQRPWATYGAFLVAFVCLAALAGIQRTHGSTTGASSSTAASSSSSGGAQDDAAAPSAAAQHATGTPEPPPPPLASTFSMNVQLVDSDKSFTCPEKAGVTLTLGKGREEFSGTRVEGCHFRIDGIPLRYIQTKSKGTLKLNKACADIARPSDPNDRSRQSTAAFEIKDAPLSIEISGRNNCVCVIKQQDRAERPCPDCYAKDGCKW